MDGASALYIKCMGCVAMVLTGVTLRLTLKASIPAWMTGTKTVSLSWESANMSGIWSRRLVTRQRHTTLVALQTALSGHTGTVWILQV